MLKTFSEIVSSNVRVQDYFGRWGGEEFILVCRYAPAEAAMAIADKPRKTVTDHVFGKDSAPLHITVSIGVTSLRAWETCDQAVKRADVALYDAAATVACLRNLSAPQHRPQLIWLCLRGDADALWVIKL